MNEVKKPGKSLIYFYVAAVLLLLLLNFFIYPLFLGEKVKEIDYGTFLTMLDKKELSRVEIGAEKITLTAKDGKVYVTGTLNDSNLVDRLNHAGVTYLKVMTSAVTPASGILTSWILPLLMFLVIGKLISRLMQKKTGASNAMSFGNSKAKVYVPAQSGKTFADVAGQDEAKDALAEIVDFLNNPDKYKKIGAKLPKGALLVGPPGTGKTLLAQAVAGEAGVPFFSISGSEFVEMFVGMGAARVRDLFRQASEKAPCIVFIDEIDAIGKRRGSSEYGGNDEREQTLNQLLTEMDGFDAGKGVVILAATNRPETLDKALLRPGRFDRRVPAELPDLAGREAILKVHTLNIKTDGHINFKAIAKATSGASGAELANIVNEAALTAVRAERGVVCQHDFEEAVETIIAGAQKKGAVILDREKKIVAYHEIGHALVAAMQKNSAPVHKITIVPRTSGALGYTMQVPEDETFLTSKEEALVKITVFTAGRAAEELVFNLSTSGAANDIEQATKIARAMVTRLGMSEEFDMMALETGGNSYLGGDSALHCSEQTAAKVDTEVLKLIKEGHRRARTILEENIDKLHQLSAFLLEKETITGEEFMELLSGDVNSESM